MAKNSSLVFLVFACVFAKKLICYLCVGYPNCPEGQKWAGKLFFLALTINQ